MKWSVALAVTGDVTWGGLKRVTAETAVVCSALNVHRQSHISWGDQKAFIPVYHFLSYLRRALQPGAPMSSPRPVLLTAHTISPQLYRVFPINNSYYLTRLLYSPNADTSARILIASEVHSSDQYSDAVKAHSGRVYPNALLRFSVFDDTPHKTPNSRYSLDMDYMPRNGASRSPSLYSVQHRSSSSVVESDKRPTVPPKPAELFAHPFEYISALSGRSPSVRSTSLRTVPMDIDTTPSSSSSQPQSQAQISAKETETSINGNTSTSSCCSTAEVKEGIRTLISDFEKEVNKTLEKGFGPAAAPQLSISVSESPKATDAPVDLGALFSEGSFPSNGPARRHSTLSHGMRGGRRHRGHRGSLPGLQPTGCLNASVQEARSLPHTPEEVVHAHVICDNCNHTVVGIRHKCLDCPGEPHVRLERQQPY